MKEIVVVEGRDDTRRLKEIFKDIDTIETNGSAIDEETLQLIEKAHAHRGVIVLTDPDFPGEKIRKTITQRIPTVKHAFITVSEASPKHKGSLGVEHAKKEAIMRAFEQVKSVQDDTQGLSDITKSFLTQMGLIGGAQSSMLRDKLSEKLGIGHVNGKQLEKRLKMFGLTQQDVYNALSNEGKGE